MVKQLNLEMKIENWRPLISVLIFEVRLVLSQCFEDFYVKLSGTQRELKLCSFK